ncbi:sensor histidine kinase [Marinicella meishanensis]|uniref:sensor histidine kinase n=1 Tax=Marinicella meishanensis TaxID=2873263 RepID=UPI001CBFB095|nr:sensor histidine kinase [Marinicella sp. NBU2979]
MRKVIAAKALVFALTFFPLSLAYALLMYASYKNWTGLKLTFVESLQYSSIVVGISTLLGLLIFLRVCSVKQNNQNIVALILKELFVILVFVILWLLLTEAILLNYWFDEGLKVGWVWSVVSEFINNTGRLHSGLFLFATYTGLSYAMFYFSEHKAALKKEKLATELANKMKMKAMMNYMQPHFFFNCISSISELIHISPRKADEALNKLSDILRYLIDTKKQSHSLESELELTHNYVDLQKLRHGSRFQYSAEVDEKFLSVQIPVLTIQLLVENSFHHAFNRFEISEKIEIKVNVNCVNNVLNIIVCDSGSENTDDAESGHGIHLLKSRLHSVFNQMKFSHGFTRKTLLGKPGYQSHLAILI